MALYTLYIGKSLSQKAASIYGQQQTARNKQILDLYLNDKYIIHAKIIKK